MLLQRAESNQLPLENEPSELPLLYVAVLTVLFTAWLQVIHATITPCKPDGLPIPVIVAIPILFQRDGKIILIPCSFYSL